jgi:putative ABC transport system permease protein
VRRIAIATLAHDRLRSAMIVVGLATAWALVIVQVGLRRGFERSALAIPDHVGGHLWVTARGVRVLDDGEAVVLGAATHPCVVGRRPIIVDYAQVRRPDRALVTVQIVGTDAASRHRVPWGLVRGSPDALAEAGVVGMDGADASKLGLPDAEIGQYLRLRSGATLRVGAVSRGARSFTQTPYLFADVQTARELLGYPPGSATFWALDLADGVGCEADVAAQLRDGDRDVVSREALAAGTVEHWIAGSGIGALLAAGSLMAAMVGAVALLQSTLTVVRTHARELATIRALGAKRSELSLFVGWQVGIVATLATLLALVLASAIAASLDGSGLSVVVDVGTWAAGLAAAALSTAAAAFVGARMLGRVDPRQELE